MYILINHELLYLDMQDVEACTAPTGQSTATTKSSTCLPPPMVTNTWVPDNPEGPEPLLGAGGILGTIEVMGRNATITTDPPQPVPTETESPSSSEPPLPQPSPYYDCEGADLCSTTNVKFCDLAVNNMQRGSNVYIANSAALAQEDNCWANHHGFGCSVKIRGKDRNGNDCQITGDDMWAAYQDISNNGDCRICGSKYVDGGCLLSVDFHYGCSNRTGRPRFHSNGTIEESDELDDGIPE